MTPYSTEQYKYPGAVLVLWLLNREKSRSRSTQTCTLCTKYNGRLEREMKRSDVMRGPTNAFHHSRTTRTAAPMATTLSTSLRGSPQASVAIARRRSPGRMMTHVATSRKSHPPRGVAVGLFSSERATASSALLPRGQPSALSSSSRGPAPPAALPPILDEVPALFQSVLVRGEGGCMHPFETIVAIFHEATRTMSPSLSCPRDSCANRFLFSFVFR